MIQLLRILLFYVTIYPLVLLFRRFSTSQHAWVIGGHSGKEYEDNAAALHKYIVTHTEQPIIWLTTNSRIFDTLSSKGMKVLWRDSLTARVAIVLAPVIIRSHGYRDIDIYFGRYIAIKGLEIHLNHSMNHIKAGQLHSPAIAAMSESNIKKQIKKLVDFDFLLACSESERQNFILSFPHKADNIVLGGGAHLEELAKLHEKNTETNSILYFPTWRRKGVRSDKTPEDVINEIVTHKELVSWLETTSTELIICTHINFKSQLEESNWPDIIKRIQPDGLAEAFCRCRVFISDYSGLIVDALYIDKPVIFFPFDLQDFLQCQYLYIDYNDFAFGPVVNTTDQLAQSLINKDWQNNDSYKVKRQQTYSNIFPSGRISYAKRSYETICRLLSTHKQKPPRNYLN